MFAIFFVGVAIVVFVPDQSGKRAVAIVMGIIVISLVILRFLLYRSSERGAAPDGCDEGL